MGPFLAPLLTIVIDILGLYKWIIIIGVLMSWLISFGVLTTANHLVRMALDVIYRLTEPAYRPIRRLLPNLGAVDFAPFIVFLIVWLVQMELGALAGQL